MQLHELIKQYVNIRTTSHSTDDLIHPFLQHFDRIARTISLPYMDTTALYYLFMDWRHVGNLNAAAKCNGLIQQNLCVWSKTNAGMGSFYRSQHELLGVYSRSDRVQNNIQLGSSGRYRTNVWVYEGVNSFSATRTDDLTDHPTIKPTQMFADIPEGDWHTANHGRAISSKWLAQKLRPYGIVAQRRNTGKVYMMADFDETFRRFLPTQTI